MPSENGAALADRPPPPPGTNAAAPALSRGETGPEAARRVAPAGIVDRLIAVGVLVYAGTGIAGMLKGGQFLDYNVLAHDLTHGQHLGILLVELGVGITVSAVMITIFFAFATRERTE